MFNLLVRKARKKVRVRGGGLFVRIKRNRVLQSARTDKEGKRVSY